VKNKFLDNRTLIDNKKIKLHFKKEVCMGVSSQPQHQEIPTHT